MDEGRDQRPEADHGQDRPADADADSWVDQWSQLFADEPPTAGEPPTREMPVYSAEQPPVDGRPKSRQRMAGHPESRPAAQARPREAERESQGDAAEILAWQRAQERAKRRAKLRANQRKAQVIQRQRPTGTGGLSGTSSPTDRPTQGRSVMTSPRSMPTADRRPVGGRASGDRIGAAGGGSGGHPGRWRRLALAAGMALLVAGVAVVGYVLTGFELGEDEVAEAVAGPRSDAGQAVQGMEVGADVVPRGISELALSTVQLIGLNDELQPECAGSGVIVKSDGTILTNAHVVTSEGGCQFTSIGVGVTVDSTSPAELLYRADVLAVDEDLDLAVLRISGVLTPEGGGALPDSFPQAPLGDSDTVQLGDNVRILGYPVIGGDTITLTTGTVSGFSSQAIVGDRALIKTDATISAGNSGGLAVDPDGRVIGIPTKARASESGPAIDCRAISDTNSDGTVDDKDNCVPVGGFLNGVRPINLALPLLDSAASADPIGSVVTSQDDVPDIDFDQVTIKNPRFALGHRGNLPVDEVSTATAGIAELCFFVDWSGIPVGTTWDGAWFVDGELEPELGFTDQLWTIEEDGRNFWLCARERNEAGLQAGVYEIGFFLQGDLIFAEGIELTEEAVEVVPVTWTNDTDGEICELRVNPFSRSGQVGLNELDEGVSIPARDSTTIDLPLGRVIVEAYNCQNEPVADAFAGLEIEGPATFLIGL